MRNYKLNILILLMLALASILIAEVKCDYCNKSITGKYVSLDGKSYHENCYRDHIQPRCQYCNELIDGSYNILDGKKYHTTCYTNHILPKCAICDQALEGPYVTDYWGNSFHQYHSEQLSVCSTCGRLICEKLTHGGFSLSDGRHLCSICKQTAVTDDYDVALALIRVKELLTSIGIRDLPTDIPISLVDKPTLKQLSDSHSDNMQGFTDHNTQTQNGRIISKRSHVYILSHLPVIMFKAVLAHELLHVYLFENDLDLRSDIREGFCNLGSELVYQDDNSEYSKFRLHNMMESQDPDYGVGYRKMSKLLYQKGWMHLLEMLDEIR